MNKHVEEYLKGVSGVYHTTIDPYGPGAVRIHLIPPKKPASYSPWVLILNGQDVLPLNTSWAILLSMFIDEVNKYAGKELSEDMTQKLIDDAVTRASSVFTSTKKETMSADLKDIICTVCDVAEGKTPDGNTGYMTLKEYARYMTAPHRMDLMISAMTKHGGWNCNQKCMHCYASGQTLSDAEELTTAEWKKVIDKCREACISQLTFTGGEPTMRDDLCELVEYASWFVTRLNTNGIRLTSELCKRLYDVSLDAVQITLYSSDKDIHNNLVGASSFDDVSAGIKNAVTAGLNVSINTPLCSLNSDYVNTIKYAASLGVRYFSCSGLILTGNAESSQSAGTRLSTSQISEILKDAMEYCKNNSLEMTFTSPGWADENVLRELGIRVPSCGACLSNMAVAPDGSVVPCQSWLSDGSLGNLLNDRWDKIWNSKKCREIRKYSAEHLMTCRLMEKSLGKEGACR